MINRILIADDDSLVNLYLETRLTREEFVVDIATNGRMASTLIRNHKYSVILVDLIEPNIGGRDLVLEIQGSSLNADTPIMALYSEWSDELIAKMLAIGIKENVLKPFSMNVITSRIKALTLPDVSSKTKNL